MVFDRDDVLGMFNDFLGGGVGEGLFAAKPAGVVKPADDTGAVKPAKKQANKPRKKHVKIWQPPANNPPTITTPPITQTTTLTIHPETQQLEYNYKTIVEASLTQKQKINMANHAKTMLVQLEQYYNTGTKLALDCLDNEDSLLDGLASGFITNTVFLRQMLAPEHRQWVVDQLDCLPADYVGLSYQRLVGLLSGSRVSRYFLSFDPDVGHVGWFNSVEGEAESVYFVFRRFIEGDRFDLPVDGCVGVGNVRGFKRLVVQPMVMKRLYDRFGVRWFPDSVIGGLFDGGGWFGFRGLGFGEVWGLVESKMKEL